jgi:5,6,7,8-tetrahydromethanopterin hydro-lyase
MTAEFVTQIGESFVGDGVNAAHLNTVLGAKGGPLESAWAAALARPAPGHTPFLAVLQPGLPVKPFTLFINKATIDGARHAEMTWGPAQAGVARGVAEALSTAIVDPALADSLLLIAAVWVDPMADDAALVYEHNARATLEALRAGRDNAPSIERVLAAKSHPFNPFFDPSV